MKPSELPGARSLYRLTNHALAQIKELWQYADEEGELPGPETDNTGRFHLPHHAQHDFDCRHRQRSSLSNQRHRGCSPQHRVLASRIDCGVQDQVQGANRGLERCSVG